MFAHHYRSHTQTGHVYTTCTASMNRTHKAANWEITVLFASSGLSAITGTSLYFVSQRSSTH
jgi:hypothetical protein